ncbi:hypothetical protein STRATTON_211 [Erwinia phage vB_EamM_Stratton]|uniref:Uncharacterized protein n=1 Tax=Erwinia phage vB_EamM_Stratton TaxID=1883378 RepID=A0A1B2IH94_9CAUD|nr:hypothetical protein STRATTON_211 [Erwinia phage vB_EamM_Stratton]
MIRVLGLLFKVALLAGVAVVCGVVGAVTALTQGWF